MKRLVVGLLSAVALAAISSAQAADMPVKAMPVKAPIAPVWSWTGFYVGANGGYSWGNWDNSGLASNSTPKVDGALGGLQAGYNWQIDRTWVVGLEGDIQITGEKASENPGNSVTTDVIGALGFTGGGAGAGFHTVTTTTTTNEWKFPWFGTFRGRVGALVDPTLLIYGTGGLAVGNFKMSSTATSVANGFRGAVGGGGTLLPPSPVTTIAASASDSATLAGWTIGAGFEKKLSHDWSVKFEYLYLDFGTRTFLSGTGLDTSVRLRDQVARIGINYQF